jgi:hypothetical protein
VLPWIKKIEVRSGVLLFIREGVRSDEFTFPSKKCKDWRDFSTRMVRIFARLRLGGDSVELGF